MKKIIIGLVFFMFGVVGYMSAQSCPSPIRGQNIGVNSSLYSASYAATSLSRITYDYAYALERGFRNGDLTRHELFVLENDLNRMTRRINRALFDGRISNSEWTFIQFDMRNLERDINREWNDDQRRES